MWIKWEMDRIPVDALVPEHGVLDLKGRINQQSFRQIRAICGDMKGNTWKRASAYVTMYDGPLVKVPVPPSPLELAS